MSGGGRKMTKSEQARADAMADAETLRVIAWEAPRAHVSNALRKARNLGVRAASEIEYGGGWLLPNVTAREAAHAAFRAVPGLRGTDADEDETRHERAHAGISEPDECDRGDG